MFSRSDGTANAPPAPRARAALQGTRTGRLLRMAGTLLAAAAAAILYAPAASAAPDPTGVSFTLEGCRNDGTILLPNGGGQFICPEAVYTTGNLGKGWHELDLVPYRITTSAGNSAPTSQTYTVAIALDKMDGAPGYDVISAPVLNTALSDASCSAATSTGPLTLSPGLGGASQTLYRKITITQSKNTDCVYDWYGRLAIGSHLYSGASLHANLANQNLGTAGIGSKEVSIPVKDILPQALDKTVTARQDASQTWGVSKSGPASVDFGDVCAAGGPQPQAAYITVTWTKLSTTPGNIVAVAIISATNPASRTITISVNDKLYQGPSATPGALLHTSNFGPTDVPARSTIVIGTDTVTLPPGTTSIGNYLNDVATGTYTDLVTGVPISGTSTAIAQAQVQAGNVSNTTAAIVDDESITGTGLSFAVATPLVGSFSGYTAGTPTTGPVTWNSGTQSNSGSVTFTKTLYLDGPRITSGTLSDQADLTASDGFTAQSNLLEIAINSSASVELTVVKTIPDFLDSGERIEVAFHVARLGDAGYSHDFTMEFVGGGVLSQQNVMTGLVPDTYVVTEGTVTFYPADYPSSPSTPIPLVPLQGSTQSQDLTVQTGSGEAYANCSGTLQFDNAPATDLAATARVQKITAPTLAADDPDFLWSFTLYGPDGQPMSSLTDVVGANQGFVAFTDPLTQSGTYHVTETTKSGWDLTLATPNDGSETTICAFSVDLLFDGGQTFDCTFNNVERGNARVVKTVSGSPPAAGQAFTFQLRAGASPTANGIVLESQVANDGNGGTVNFATMLVAGNPYQLCEVVMPGWMSTITDFVPGSFLPPDGIAPNPDVDNSTVCVEFSVDPGETRTFTVDNNPPPGGYAHTIGFWKNWASCKRSNGKQDPVLDETLATFPIAGGQSTPGIYVGLLYVDTCPEAVNLLNKSKLNGKKAANDPAFRVAAQLLAAQLNLQAGAGSCPAVTSAVSQAQSLLTSISFNGMTHAAISKSAANTYNSLAATLDLYNNNMLCGY